MVIFIFWKYTHKIIKKKLWEENDFTQIPYNFREYKFEKVTKIIALQMRDREKIWACTYSSACRMYILSTNV